MQQTNKSLIGYNYIAMNYSVCQRGSLYRESRSLSAILRAVFLSVTNQLVMLIKLFILKE